MTAAAPAYLPRGVRRCACGAKILYALRGAGHDQVVAYDFSSPIYWTRQTGERERYAVRMILTLSPDLTGALGPAIPHVLTCPRGSERERRAFRREGPSPSRVKRCGCGARMVFGWTEARTKVPLDVDAHVDWLREEFVDGARVLTAAPMPFDGAGGGAVSHFRTCPRASDYSRQKPYARAASDQEAR